MTEYRLGSNGLIYAPGMIRWAINGYAFQKDRQNLRRVIVQGWHIPEDAAHALLSGATPYTIEGDIVAFSYGEPQT